MFFILESSSSWSLLSTSKVTDGEFLEETTRITIYLRLTLRPTRILIKKALLVTQEFGRNKAHLLKEVWILPWTKDTSFSSFNDNVKSHPLFSVLL
jgi:hypothetical protein